MGQIVIFEKFSGIFGAGGILYSVRGNRDPCSISEKKRNQFWERMFEAFLILFVANPLPPNLL